MKYLQDAIDRQQEKLFKAMEDAKNEGIKQMSSEDLLQEVIKRGDILIPQWYSQEELIHCWEFPEDVVDDFISDHQQHDSFIEQTDLVLHTLFKDYQAK